MQLVKRLARAGATVTRLPRLWTVTLLLVSSCADDSADSDDACYPLDPMLPIEPPSFPLCDWPASALPEPPDGYEYTNRVTVVFTPTAEEPCDPCDLERFDALLKAEIDNECDQPYVDFQRGCYSPPDGTGMGSGDRCSVYGIYASDCIPTGQ